VFFGVCLMLMGLRPWAALVALCAAGAHFALPFLAGLNQAIWQAEVPSELQGRVFALREALVRAVQPLAPLAIGVLADQVFARLTWTSGPLAGALTLLLGTGPGRGLGLLFLALGAPALLAALIGLAAQRRRGPANSPRVAVSSID
jgi:hypothetical protein